MAPNLAVVTESPAARIRRLQAEARQLAADQVRALAAQMVAVEQMAGEIAGGGDAYPVGVREFARSLAIEVESRIQTMDAIASRTTPRRTT